MYHLQQNTLYPLKGSRFCEENFLRYLFLCYINPAYHKLKIFRLLLAVNKVSLGCEPIRIFKKLFLQNLLPLGVKGILLLLAHRQKECELFRCALLDINPFPFSFIQRNSLCIKSESDLHNIHDTKSFRTQRYSKETDY